MSDTDSKLTGWISVCRGAPPCQPLSAHPVRPFHKRQGRHKGVGNIGGSEVVVIGGGYGGVTRRKQENESDIEQAGVSYDE